MNRTALILILFFTLFLQCKDVNAQASEYRLKAVFLERFTRFIEWPEKTSISDTSKPFVIKIIGKNPFGDVLKAIYSRTKIKNKPVKIYYISSVEEIKDCQILFIAASMENSLEQILKYTNEKPILTIGDCQGFGQRGVIINFFILNNKVRFEINEKTLNQSRLYLSYLLLNVATVIKGEEGDK